MKVLLLIATLVCAPLHAHGLDFQQAKSVKYVIRCNTEELAKVIIQAYKKGEDEGNAALNEAAATRNQYGKVDCNVVEEIPLYISLAETIRDADTQTGGIYHLLRVQASARQNGPFKESFLVVRDETLNFLFGSQH